jgi:hypothetical protein
VRRSSTERNPCCAAVNAVARQWFDCSPPQVTSVSAPPRSASANRNSSLRILLPDSSVPVRSSRLTNSSTPKCSLLRGRKLSGVGARARLILSGYVIVDMRPPCGLGRGARIRVGGQKRAEEGSRHKAPSRSFPGGAGGQSQALTHSTAILRGPRGRRQGRHRPARAVPRTLESPGEGAGRRGWPRSAAADREAWFRSGRSVGGRPPHFTARCYVSQRCAISGAGAAPLRFAPSFIRFHGDLRDPSSSRAPLARELV